MLIVSFYQFKMKTCVIQIARVITQMAKRAGILSRVMSDGLRSHDIEYEARMAWKFACSSKLIRWRTPLRGSKTSGAVIRKTLPVVDDPFNIRNCIKWAWRTFPEITLLRLIHIHICSRVWDSLPFGARFRRRFYCVWSQANTAGGKNKEQ